MVPYNLATQHLLCVIQARSNAPNCDLVGPQTDNRHVSFLLQKVSAEQK